MLSIRPATIDDAALLRTLIRELAEFERQLEFCVIEEADLVRDGFGSTPKFRALIAEWDGKPAGYALFFGYYSTWVGPGLCLEDLFVRIAVSRKGNWDGVAGCRGAHRVAGKLLRNAMGSARLE